MLSTLKPVVLLALLAGSVVADVHTNRHARHHAIAARGPGADTATAVVAQSSSPVKRKTCRARPTSSALLSSSVAASSSAVSSAVTSSSIEITSSSEAQTSTSEVKTTSSSAKPTSTEAPPPPPPSSSAAPPPPPPTSTSTHHSKPTPTPTPSPTPTPTSTKEAPPPPPTSSPSGGGGDGGVGGFMSGTNSGDGTFYATGLVACGQTYSDTDYVAAISFLAFDAFPGAGDNPNLNPICGKKIRATYQGKSVDVAIVDRCAGCFIKASIDFTPAAFNQIADPAVGRIHGLTWEWL